jgi:phage protein U
MLYQLGPVTVDTFPFSVDAVDRESSADFAAKDLLGRIKGQEFVGEGDDTLSLKGKILPFKPRMNGLPAWEVLHGLRKSGEPLYVMRGDFIALGWFVITNMREGHSMLHPNGIGQQIEHEIRLLKVDAPGPDTAGALVGSLLSLFG